MTELTKAIKEATEAGIALLKSQTALPGAGTTNLTKPEIIRNRKDGIFTKPEARQMFNEAHHAAYTRSNASGTVSHIQAKGTENLKANIKHPAFSMKDRKGNVTFHDYNTGEHLPSYEGPFHPDGHTDKTMHTWINKYGERNHHIMTKEAYNAKYGEDFGREKSAHAGTVAKLHGTK